MLRAVYDDGNHHSEGRVRGTWSSGIVVETDVRPGIGSAVALVILGGGFDGARLSARVCSVEQGALVLELPGLDTTRFRRLQALVDGKPLPPFAPTGAPPAPPPQAPAFIISGGEGELDGDPTGTFELTPEMRKSGDVSVPPGDFVIPSPFERAPTTRPPAPAPSKQQPSKSAPQPPLSVSPAPASTTTLPPPSSKALKTQPSGTPVSSLSSSSGQPVQPAAKPSSVAFAPAPITVPGLKSGGASTEELEQQLVDLGRKNAALVDENTKLKRDLERLRALKDAVDDELADAHAKLDAIERALGKKR